MESAGTTTVTGGVVSPQRIFLLGHPHPRRSRSRPRRSTAASAATRGTVPARVGGHRAGPVGGSQVVSIPSARRTSKTAAPTPRAAHRHVHTAPTPAPVQLPPAQPPYSPDPSHQTPSCAMPRRFKPAVGANSHAQRNQCRARTYEAASPWHPMAPVERTHITVGAQVTRMRDHFDQAHLTRPIEVGLPDPHPIGRIQPEPVARSDLEGLVEFVKVPHHLIAPELRR